MRALHEQHLRMPLYTCKASLMSPASLQMRVMSRYVTWSALFLDGPHTCAHEQSSSAFVMDVRATAVLIVTALCMRADTGQQGKQAVLTLNIG